MKVLKGLDCAMTRLNKGHLSSVLAIGGRVTVQTL